MNFDELEEYDLDSSRNPYQIVSEKKEPYIKQLYWDMAIGLQAVDNLTPSDYLIKLSNENIEGKINTYEVEDLLKAYYKDKDLNIRETADKHECDIVATRIVELIDDPRFSFNVFAFKEIHKYLFKDIYDFAGKIRNYNISKKEFILNRDTVFYSPYDRIEATLNHDLKEEKEFDYTSISIRKQVERIADFTSRIWQVHPFGEGNTRTVAVFMTQYLKNIGYNVSNKPFKDNSAYFRNALVRSNYSNREKGIKPTLEYLIKFYENLIADGTHELKSRDLIVNELFSDR